jgi:hypothetical protein
VGTWSADGAVSGSLVASLVAAFNSGFQLASSRGGWYSDGRAAYPLRNGAASLVVFSDGGATVGMWGRDVSLTPNVTQVRQNLTLLVDQGAPVGGLSSNILGTWGATLHSVVFTWRSGLGVDGAGRLVYVAGPFLDPSTLAGALVAAGAVRAMELDINPAWVGFDSYTGSTTGTKLLSAMNLSASRFVIPYWRDFVAVFSR